MALSQDGTWFSSSTQRLIALSLEEDLAYGDITSALTVSPNARCQAVIEARQAGVLCGIAIAREVFSSVAAGGHIPLDLTDHLADGDSFEAGQHLITLQGRTLAVLAGERCALNFLQRLCGVATITHRFCQALDGTGVAITDTRKTTPGWRGLEKYAVRCGGGRNHRFGLGDGILLKDNHIKACGGVYEAVSKAKANGNHLLKVEVEVTDADQLEQALAARADVVLLDNMSPKEVARSVSKCKGKALVEVSGGITLDTVRQYALSGPDFISAGALTHSAPSCDISLEIQ